jgi:hypothetical protein
MPSDDDPLGPGGKGSRGPLALLPDGIAPPLEGAKLPGEPGLPIPPLSPEPAGLGLLRPLVLRLPTEVDPGVGWLML